MIEGINVRYFLILFFITFPLTNSLSQNPNQAERLEPDNKVVALLKNKASEEGKILYLKSSWFSNITLSEDYRDLPLETILDRLLPNLGLKYINFPPNHYVIVLDLDHTSGLNLSANNTTGKNKTHYTFDPTKKYTITGTIIDNKNEESVIGATLFVKEIGSGTITNEFGTFSMTLPSSMYHISITALGFDSEEIEMPLVSDTTLNITLFDRTTRLQEIIIYDEAEDKNVSDISMGTTRLNLQTLKKIPPMMGEVDVLRSIMLLPGVTTVGEGATGYNVRGGSVDQNLILLDDAPIFNPSHFFGFFTAFNSRAVKDVTISKGGIPAQYGGRISSILDVKIRQGNKNKIQGEGGLGLVSSNLMLDGPLNKGKTTFLISGRTTYSDWFLHALPDNYLKKSSAYFHDFIGKITHKINESNTVAITGYTSLDKFKFPGDTTYGWTNNSMTVKWANTINPKLNMVNSFIFSNYNYTVWGSEIKNGFKWQAGVDFYSVKSDFTYVPNLKNKIDFGLNLNYYTVRLGSLIPDGEDSNVNIFNIDPEYALESALFYNQEYNLSPDITLMGGLRYSYYAKLGPGIKRIYDPDLPKGESTVIDEISYDRTGIMADYGGLEPRLSLRYGLNRNTSLKASYNRMRQYIHLISNTSAVSPVDIWKLSDSYIKPQIGDQVSAGIFRNFKANTYETSIEFFYKYINNSIDYKDGADLVLNRNLETELLNGNIRAYGAELLIRKNKGRFNGWISYTLSKTENRVSGRFPVESINQGNYYPVNYDKLHDLAIVGNYDFTRRHSLGFNFVLYSGRPITYPVGSFGYAGFLIANFEYRNQERIPAYHRLDISFTIDGNHKKNKKWHGSWTFSVYNLYGRKNPYSIFFKARGFIVPQAFRLSVIGSMIPAVTYNFKF